MIIIQFSVGTRVQIIQEGSHFGELVVVTDFQVVQRNPATKKRVSRYQVELNSGELRWFDEHQLCKPVQQFSALKQNRQWLPTSIAVVLGIVAVVFGVTLLHSHPAVSTPQKAVLAYIKHYPKVGKHVALASQPVEYYDDGAYVLGKSSGMNYVIFYAAQNSQGQWIARAVAAFSSKNYPAPKGYVNVGAMSNPGFFEIRSPVLVTGTTAKTVVGYGHLVGHSQHEIPFTFHRLWNSTYWIRYFPSYTITSSSSFGSIHLPVIQLDKVVAYDKDGKIISR